MSLKEVSALFEEFWEWRMRESPEFASYCGDHRYDDRLDDYSLDAFAKRLVDAKKFLEKCNKLAENTGLDENEELSLAILTSDLETYISGASYEGYCFPVSYMEGVHADWEQYIAWMDFKNLEDFRKYSSRVKSLSKRIKQSEDLMRHGASKGITFHPISMSGVVEDLEAMQSAEPESTVFLKPFKSAPKDIDKSALKSLEETTVQVVKNEVQPALKSLSDCIANEYMRKCRPKEGVFSIPNGEKFYQECLDWHLTLKMTPQEVHDLGLKEVARIKHQMDEAIKKTGFKGDFPAFLEHLRTDKKFYFDSQEAMLKGFKDICDIEIRPTLKMLFHNIPSSKLEIEEVPESKRNGPAGYYIAGTVDGSRPGKFYVNCHKLDMCPKYEMMTLSLHEGEPGHHFQGMYAIEMKNAPRFRQYIEDLNYYMVPSRFPMNTAYCEGWGLYSEYLGEELGLYKDPYVWFGHLSFEMHRACRLVADTGLHAMGWTYDETMKFFLENTALSESFIRNEIHRYITWPGQACAYKVGELKLKEFREKAAKKLGDRFDVRDFHEVVLSSLMVSMSVLESLVDKYIENKLAA